MSTTVQALVSFMLAGGLALGAGLGLGQDETAGSPEEQYSALLRQAERASSSGRPLSDEERLEFIGQVYRHRHAIAIKFLALAVAHPDDPIAVDALVQAVWQVNTTPWPVDLVGEDVARSRALAILLSEHLANEKLGPLCERISHGFCEDYETFLRSVLGKTPHREVRAAALVSLAHFLQNRWQRIELCRGHPATAAEFGALYGEDYLQRLLLVPAEQVIAEVEELCGQALEHYADVELAEGGTIAERAAAEIFGLRSLQVGRRAPEIHGIDQEGGEFRLSDYRGKVVLLDFWSYV